MRNINFLTIFLIVFVMLKFSNKLVIWCLNYTTIFLFFITIIDLLNNLFIKLVYIRLKQSFRNND